MHKIKRFHLAVWLLLLGIHAAFGQAVRFSVKYDPALGTKALTGRLFLILTDDVTETPLEPWIVRPDPFFAKDVVNWRPGEEVVFGEGDAAFPTALADVARKPYLVQAVLDVNTTSRKFTRAPGNCFSELKVVLPGKDTQVRLTLSGLVPEPTFTQTELTRNVTVPSKLLSTFLGKDTYLKAAVLLPPSYFRSGNTRYPVVYLIPGFGRSYYEAEQYRQYFLGEAGPDNLEKVVVVLDADCGYGHHAFADSDNNGPRARALVEELVPYLEKHYRLLAKPAARLLSGHSSGGWSSLWLQVNYPDFFGGVWATAPDPVDFSDFMKLNIYKTGENAFYEDAAMTKPRILERLGKIGLTYKELSDRENVTGNGEQLGSFESVFSPRDQQGRPAQLWDRQTGIINPAVANAWKKYDIRLLLEKNREKIGHRLAGKLTVMVGGQDEFYLDGAVRRFKQLLDAHPELGQVTIIEAFDHNAFYRPEVMHQINAAMNRSLRASLTGKGDRKNLFTQLKPE